MLAGECPCVAVCLSVSARAERDTRLEKEGCQFSSILLRTLSVSPASRLHSVNGSARRFV